MIQNVLNNDLHFLIDNIGYKVKINDKESKALINNNVMGELSDDKTIICFDKLNEGDIITCNDVEYIIISLIVDIRYKQYYKGIIRPINHKFKLGLKDKEYKIQEYKAYIESVNFNINKTSANFPISLDEKFVYIVKDDFNINIAKQNRIMLWGRAYEVIGIDLGLGNLLILEVKEVELNDNDNIELGVCDYWKYNTKPSKPIDPPPVDPPTIEPIGIYVENNAPFNKNTTVYLNTKIKESVSYSFVGNHDRCTLYKVGTTDNRCRLKIGSIGGIFKVKATLDSDSTRYELLRVSIVS